MLSLFPRGILDEILNLIESVSEGFPSYSYYFIVFILLFIYYYIIIIIFIIIILLVLLFIKSLSENDKKNGNNFPRTKSFTGPVKV